MSYDLDIYTARAPVHETELLSGAVSDAPLRRRIERPQWRIVVDGPVRVEDEDLPDGLAATMPGLTFLTRINVEGVAPELAIRLAWRIAEEIARGGFGAVVDPQAGTIRTPRGVRRFAVGGQVESGPHPIWMSWLFLDTDSFRAEGFDRLLGLMEAQLPELLPRRYGHYEPPQYRWVSERKDDFVTFAREAHFDLVWYPFKPARHFGLGIPMPAGPERRGFRVGYIHAQFDGTVAQHPGWRRQLARFFTQTSAIVQPFYGEIRPGGTPLPQSWWWNGIPKSRGLMTALGPPYLDLWPAFREVGVSGPGGIVMVDTFSGDKSIMRRDVPAVPVDIVQPEDPSIKQIDETTGAVLAYAVSGLAPGYPKVWPFDGPTA